jgi:hypothetical protein
MEMTATNADKPDERALEEWKQLETCIGRYEGQEFQVRSWLFVILGAFGAALYAEKSKLSGFVFAAGGGALVWVYCYMELIIRIPKRKAYKRVGEIEMALRGEIPYDGPRMSLALGSDGPKSPMFWRELRKLRVWSFYLSVFMIVVVIGILSG